MDSRTLIFNMKMYMDINDVRNYLTQLPKLPDNVIVCPEMMYIPYFLTKYSNISLQNIYSINEGAYTGEVSAQHAKKLGIDYTVIGHSERRIYFQEDDNMINAKIKTALDNDLKVILCIGEMLEDYEKGNTEEKIFSQIMDDLFDNNKFNQDNLIIAYEPVWAIGTGKVPTNEEISKTVKFIKQIILKQFGINIKVMYGGSVNSSNIESLNTIDNIDGFMVGGASTKVDEVNKMIKVVNG